MAAVVKSSLSYYAAAGLSLVLAALGATAGCASDASGGSQSHQPSCVLYIPPPKYETLSPPSCDDARDEASDSDCWRVSPATGGRFQQVSASCGVTEEGRIECWKDAVAKVPEGHFDLVDDDGLNACAAGSEGGAACWGRAPWPKVPSSPKFTAVAVGGNGHGESDSGGVQACGLTVGQDIVCWGDGSPHGSGHLFLEGPFAAFEKGGSRVIGQRPDGSLETYLGREMIEKEAGAFKSFSEAVGGGCQVRASGEVSCDRFSVHPDAETRAPADLGPTEVVRRGMQHACVLELDGGVRCWGDFRPPPDLDLVQISQPDLFDSYCGITRGGEAYCWGDPSRRPRL